MLERDFNEFQLHLGITMEAYHVCLQFYNDEMQKSFNGVDYFGSFDLTKLHQSVKNEAIAQVQPLFGVFA